LLHLSGPGYFGTIAGECFNIEFQLLHIAASISFPVIQTEHILVVFGEVICFNQTPIMSVFQLCLDCLRLILDYLYDYSVTLLSKNWSDFFSEVNIIDYLKLCGGRDAFYCVLG
jgi:hypothetical protein